MGMDVSGIDPSSKDGEYFRASVWSWPPLLELCEEAIRRFDLGIDTDGWEFNDGKGCRDPEKCVALAGGLDRLLEETGPVIEAKAASEAAEAFLAAMGEAGAALKRSGPLYRTDAERVRRFCTFLRACGGFEIH